MKPGDRIRIIRMDDDGGKDWQARELNGKTYTISFIDSAGQIYIEETGLALIPGIDGFVPVLLFEGKGRSSLSLIFYSPYIFHIKTLYLLLPTGRESPGGKGIHCLSVVINSGKILVRKELLDLPRPGMYRLRACTYRLGDSYCSIYHARFTRAFHD